MKTLMPLRLLIVNNILTPYNLSFFAAAAGRADVTARTVFLAPNDTNRQWNIERDSLTFDHRVLPSLRSYIARLELPLYLHWGLWSEMRRFGPHVIAICGYHYFATLEVLAFARRYGIRTVLWSGSHLLSGFIKRRWADAYKRFIITRFDSYLTYGTAAKEQLIYYGAPANRIIVGCNTVDVHWFKARAEALGRPPRVGAPVRLLYVGRLVPIKNVAALINAVGSLQHRGMPVTLAIAGDGPEKASLQSLVTLEGVKDVAFLGFRTGDALVEAYAGADVLVLPSLNEPWGLVVNEAAACGVPSVVSTRAGATRDLIRNGETGLQFDPTVPGDLEQTLEQIVRDPTARQRMGGAAQHFILSRDPAYYAERLVTAARLALAQPGH